jgi:hypothetical protein
MNSRCSFSMLTSTYVLFCPFFFERGIFGRFFMDVWSFACSFFLAYDLLFVNKYTTSLDLFTYLKSISWCLHTYYTDN